MDEKTIVYKCPNCSAALKYDAKSEKMLCEYCNSSFDVESLKEYEEVLKKEKEAKEPEFEQYTPSEIDGEKSLYTCKSCGAQLISDDTTAATICPYCGNAAVITDRIAGIFKPDMVIPFKVEKKEAKQAFQSFCKKKFLLPRDFIDENKIDEVKGVYVPFWLFDADVDADMTYNATRVRSYRHGDYMITETSHYLVRREGDVGFDLVPVDGSIKMDDEYMEAIEPFDYREAVDFNTAYLSGFLADKYDVDSDSASPRVSERITNSTRQMFNQTVSGYSSVSPRTSSINVHKSRIRYALLPVWVFGAQYKGKTYRFAMNGQTGKFVGELPVSKKRFWALFGAISAAFCAVGTLLAFLL
ncbi:MAG: hypothetical protein SOZ62_03185 [Eubacteriales bacterium]|nr:hypothetical protein [Eubacteriales bacterium]